MTSIKIETDANGCEMIILTDVEKYGKRGRGLPAANILISASDGHVFVARPNLPGLSRLGEVDAELVRHYLGEIGGAHEPNIFAGDDPDG